MAGDQAQLIGLPGWAFASWSDLSAKDSGKEVGKKVEGGKEQANLFIQEIFTECLLHTKYRLNERMSEKISRWVCILAAGPW